MIAATSFDSAFDAPAVAVGGVGGSGTRLIARLLQRLGFRIGDECHTQACDALWFTLLFKRIEILDADDAQFDFATRMLVAALAGGRPPDDDDIVAIRRLARAPRLHHPVSQLEIAAQTLIAAARAPAHGARWGWKEPNTHVVVERLWPRLPRLRYVHVVRNGLDMAFSRNQRQRMLWGPRALGREPADTPRDSLAYWCSVHRRVAAMGRGMGDRFLWLDYDALCRHPAEGLAELARFLGFPPEDLVAMADLVAPPESIGRGAGVPLAQFDPDDLAFLRQIGHLD